MIEPEIKQALILENNASTIQRLYTTIRGLNFKNVNYKTQISTTALTFATISEVLLKLYLKRNNYSPFSFFNMVEYTVLLFLKRDMATKVLEINKKCPEPLNSRK